MIVGLALIVIGIVSGHPGLVSLGVVCFLASLAFIAFTELRKGNRP